MGTVADKLTYLNNTKQGLKNVINYTSAGIDSNTTFRDYEEKLYNGYLDILKDDGETLFNNLPKVTGEGTSVTLNDTANSKMKIELEPSELSQDGIPTPETPQEIHTISGDNEIVVGNINIWDEEWEVGSLNYSTGVKENDESRIRSKNYISVKPNTTYYLLGGNGSGRECFYDKNKNHISSASVYNKTFTTPNNAYYMMFTTAQGYGNTYKNDICINVSNENINGTYYSHQEQTLPLNLGDLEYCKIGDYEDEFVYNETDTTLELNKWYLKKNIGKVVLDGSETWENYNGGHAEGFYVYFRPFTSFKLGFQTTKCTHFNNVSASWMTDLNKNGRYSDHQSLAYRYFVTNEYDTNTKFKEFVANEYQNNTPITLYGKLSTPTYTLLNDTLQTQLNNIRDKVLAYQDQTNISQVNNDLPFRLKLSAIQKYTE